MLRRSKIFIVMGTQIAVSSVGAAHVRLMVRTNNGGGSPHRTGALGCPNTRPKGPGLLISNRFAVNPTPSQANFFHGFGVVWAEFL